MDKNRRSENLYQTGAVDTTDSMYAIEIMPGFAIDSWIWNTAQIRISVGGNTTT